MDLHQKVVFANQTLTGGAMGPGRVAVEQAVQGEAGQGQATCEVLASPGCPDEFESVIRLARWPMSPD